jgi:HSP20 family molecular chaperone IbpA
MDLLDDPTTNTRIATFELPGIKVTDVTLQIQRGSLVIAGERRPPQAVQKALESARTSLARNPVAAADSIALGDMVDDSESNPAPSLALHELRFGQFGRAIPVPEGIKVCSHLS